jgi:hypothetical protein
MEVLYEGCFELIFRKYEWSPIPLSLMYPLSVWGTTLHHNHIHIISSSKGFHDTNKINYFLLFTFCVFGYDHFLYMIWLMCRGKLCC